MSFTHATPTLIAGDNQMIRKTCLVKFTGSWPSPDLSNVNMLETTWRDWARYETFKRYVKLFHTTTVGGDSFLPLSLVLWPWPISKIAPIQSTTPPPPPLSQPSWRSVCHAMTVSGAPSLPESGIKSRGLHLRMGLVSLVSSAYRCSKR